MFILWLSNGQSCWMMRTFPTSVISQENLRQTLLDISTYYISYIKIQYQEQWTAAANFPSTVYILQRLFILTNYLKSWVFQVVKGIVFSPWMPSWFIQTPAHSIALINYLNSYLILWRKRVWPLPSKDPCGSNHSNNDKQQNEIWWYSCQTTDGIYMGMSPFPPINNLYVNLYKSKSSWYFRILDISIFFYYTFITNGIGIWEHYEALLRMQLIENILINSKQWLSRLVIYTFKLIKRRSGYDHQHCSKLACLSDPCYFKIFLFLNLACAFLAAGLEQIEWNNKKSGKTVWDNENLRQNSTSFFIQSSYLLVGPWNYHHCVPISKTLLHVHTISLE